MGFLEELLDRDKTYRTFVFKDKPLNEEDESIERRIQVSIDDLERIFRGQKPDSLSSGDFRLLSQYIKHELKQYKKGKIVFLSKVNDEVWAKYNKDLPFKKMQKGHTYVKNKK